jgi:hypothetical protein
VTGVDHETLGGTAPTRHHSRRALAEPVVGTDRAVAGAASLERSGRDGSWFKSGRRQPSPAGDRGNPWARCIWTTEKTALAAPGVPRSAVSPFVGRARSLAGLAIVLASTGVVLGADRVCGSAEGVP